MATPTTRSERRRRSTRIRVAIAVAVVVIVAGAVGVFASTGGSDGERATPSTLGTTSTTAEPVAVGPNVSAELGDQTFFTVSVSGRDIPVYAAPDPNAAPTMSLSRRTEYLQPRTLLAFNAFADWIQVYLPTRPNNSTGWVKANEVKVSPEPIEWSVKVSLADFRVTVLRNGVVDFETDAAIGSDVYPTPTGVFYFTDPLDLRNQPGTGYGVFAIGLSGHSNVLSEFAGGPGQIAIHGTDNPGDVGQAISHGCIRVTNDAILRISALPLGTPVYIT